MQRRCFSVMGLFCGVGLAACTGAIAPGMEEPDVPVATPGVWQKPGAASGPQPSTGTGGGTNAGAGLPALVSAPTASARFARLTHVQWENTVRDLLRLPDRPGLSSRFTVDSVRSRFDNVADNLVVDAEARSSYQEAAEALARQVARDPQALSRLAPASNGDLTSRGRRFVEAVAPRAYRRALDEPEIARLQALFAKGPTLVDGADPYVAGVELVLQALLQSPFFLYRTELSTKAVQGRIPLDAYEVASRLSYALTGTMPDDELFAVAREGRLAQPPVLRAQVERLLGAPAGLAMVEDFHAQLLQMHDYDAINKDAATVPSFVPALRGDMRRESLSLAREVFSKGEGLGGLLTANYSFVNKRLAGIYGLSGSFSDDAFTRVNLDQTRRLGVLTHAGFLAKNAHGPDSDPIHRGVFLALNIVCKPLPPPVDDISIPELPSDLTGRERVEKITGKGTCGAACHGLFINPVGFAFEHYDGIGQYRTMEKGKPVNAADQYELDGQLRSFKDATELVRHLAASREVHECYAGGWLEYLMGRERRDEDGAFVRALGEHGQKGQLPAKALVATIVTSDGFLSRAP